MSRDNTGKHKNFSDGSFLTAADLNTSLQQNIANELDAVINEAVGDGVIATGFGTHGWTASEASPPSLNVSITAGVGYIQGQRVQSTGTTTITGLPINQTSKVYVYPTGSASFDNTNKSWPASFGHTTGAIPDGSMQLATVITDGTNITTVTHTVFVIETPKIATSNINDAVTAAASARSWSERFNHFATRLKQIIDPAGSWDSAVLASLADLFEKFDPATGHAHSGAAGDGAKVQASNVIFAPTGGIAATNVQAALAELESEKVAKSGDTMTGPLSLDFVPTAGSHAINYQFLKDNVGTGPNYAYGNITENKALTTTFVNFATVNITTTGGGVLLSPETGLMALGDFSPQTHRTITIQYQRNGTPVKTVTNTVGNFQSSTVAAEFNVPLEVLGYVHVPDFFDNGVIGTGGSYAYTLWLKVDSTVDFTAATSFIPGRLNAIEFK
jgi:hypothetical protein